MYDESSNLQRLSTSNHQDNRIGTILRMLRVMQNMLMVYLILICINLYGNGMEKVKP